MMISQEEGIGFAEFLRLTDHCKIKG